MIKLIAISILLTGCTTLDPQSQAVVSMVRRGYDVTEIDLFTNVIIVGDRKNIPCGKKGYCNPETHNIILWNKAGYDTEWHEYMHLYLLRCGVDISRHHDIMNRK